MIKVQNITYKVGNKVLLDDVSVHFLPGKLNLIIGPNGAGKSTLVKIMCNQLKPTSGVVMYENKPITKYSFAELAKVRSVLSQNIDMAFALTVEEVVMMGRYPHFSGQPKEKDVIACTEAMNFFNVIHLADRNYLTLSGGEKQRVQFARVCAQIWYPVSTGSRYLLLDEPLTFLDVRYQFEFMNKIMELLKNTDLVVVGVLHDLNLVSKYADNVLLLNEGKLLASGSKSEVLTTHYIQEAYKLKPVIYNENRSTYLFFE